MIKAHSKKYHNLYWDIAQAAAKQSVADKKKVGACIVTATGMIAVGWNGMPSGMSNDCEFFDCGNNYKTKPEVIHAERNALNKLSREGISPKGAIVFITLAPCLECASSLREVGITEVHYLEEYKTDAGVNHLKQLGIPIYKDLL